MKSYNKVIKDVDAQLKEMMKIRFSIIFKKNRLKSLCEIAPIDETDNYGLVTLDINGQKVAMKEETYRLMVNEDVKDLINELNEDIENIKNFNICY